MTTDDNTVIVQAENKLFNAAESPSDLNFNESDKRDSFFDDSQFTFEKKMSDALAVPVTSDSCDFKTAREIDSTSLVLNLC